MSGPPPGSAGPLGPDPGDPVNNGYAPRLVLLDEVLPGLTPAEIGGALALVREIRRRSGAILFIGRITRAVVEQNVVKALEIAARAYVLEGGRVVCQGRPGELPAQSLVREAYLGADLV